MKLTDTIAIPIEALLRLAKKNSDVDAYLRDFKPEIFTPDIDWPNCIETGMVGMGHADKGQGEPRIYFRDMYGQLFALRLTIWGGYIGPYPPNWYAACTRPMLDGVIRLWVKDAKIIQCDWEEK